MRVLVLLIALAGCAFWGLRATSAAGPADGQAVVTYFTNGQMKTRTAYRDGRRHGLHEAWYADGSPRLAGRYENGRREGAWEAWSPDGRRDEQESATYRGGDRVEG